MDQSDWIRLAFQASVAVAIAGVSVRWALTRYKREKLWDRKLGMYADLIAAMEELRALIQQWLRSEREADAERQARGMPYQDEGPSERFWEKYGVAFQKFEGAIHLAQLIVPDSISVTLSRLHGDIVALSQKPDIASWDSFEILNDEFKLIDDRFDDLLRVMRKDLGV